jgi:hypothetical protein
MRTGAPAPPPPQLQLNGADIEARHAFIYEGQQLSEERRRAVGKAYPRVLAQAEAQAAELVKETRPIVEELVARMDSLAELLGAIRACRDSANYESTERREYRDQRLDVQGFVAMVAAGGDPLGTLDLTGGRREPPDRGRGLTAGDVQAALRRTQPAA